MRSLAGAVLIGATLTSCSGGPGDGSAALLRGGPLMFIGTQLRIYGGTSATIRDFDQDGYLDSFGVHVDDAIGLRWALAHGSAAEVFGPYVDIPGLDSGVLTLGDFDGDGLLDVAEPEIDFSRGTEVTTDVAIYLLRADGSFDEPYRLGLAVEGFWNPLFKSGDFDGDGTADIIFGSSDRALVTLLNDGTGAFRVVEQMIDASGTDVSELADLNNDGFDDLILYDFEGPYAIRAALSRGDGTFEDPVTVISPAENFNLTPHDFNSDGVPDFAGLVEGAGIAVLPGNGDGSFGPTVVTPLPVALVDPRITVVADFNHDGALDLAFITDLPPAVINPLRAQYLALGNGDGTFATPLTHIVDSQTSFSRTARALDVDRDGILDYVAVPDDSVGLRPVHFGNGDGTFRVETPESIATSSDLSLLFTEAPDLDGDGNPDVLANSFGPGGHTVLYGDGDGGFTAGNGNTAVYSRTRKVDLDDDGDLDYYAFDALTGILTVHRTYGRDDIRTLPPIPIVQAGDWRLEYIDVDGDGEEDWLLHGDAASYALFGLGDLQFEPATPIGLTSQRFANILRSHFHDVNGDGRLDYIRYDGVDERIVVQLATGVREFGGEIASPPAPGPDSVTLNIAEFADFGAGRIGAAQTWRESEPGAPWHLFVHLANPDGTFSVVEDFLVTGEFPDTALRDVDGDRDADIVVFGLFFSTGRYAQDAQIFVNNGAGEFQLSQHFHAHFKPPFSSFNVNLVDVSGEGLVDIVFWNEKSGFSVSLNEGGGTFRGPYHFAVNMSASRATYGDFDHDGDTDIVAASPTRDALFYLENFFVD